MTSPFSSAVWFDHWISMATRALLFSAGTSARHSSPAGLGRRRLPFWRQGQVERAKSGNFGTADWMPISEAKKRLPNGPGIVVGEAYRVDQDKAAKRPFNPKDRRSWGKGGSAPLLEYQCDTSSTHGLVFAGAGGFKSTSIAVPTLVRWPHSIITLDPSNELAPMHESAFA